MRYIRSVLGATTINPKRLTHAERIRYEGRLRRHSLALSASGMLPRRSPTGEAIIRQTIRQADGGRAIGKRRARHEHSTTAHAFVGLILAILTAKVINDIIVHSRFPTILRETNHGSVGFKVATGLAIIARAGNPNDSFSQLQRPPSRFSMTASRRLRPSAARKERAFSDGLAKGPN